ncbi:hypothetical protein IE4803_CH02406 [Rhizobium etli bv. phaseoli str. IE4803]|nr:hypothetical protein IE4803_CH02406 [Rhizobium etli bv. phaseoli str. IE4803]
MRGGGWRDCTLIITVSSFDRAGKLNFVTPEERAILKALVSMCVQYMDDGRNGLVHKSISAGEDAVEVLASYSLVKSEPWGGFWTDEDLRLLDED